MGFTFFQSIKSNALCLSLRLRPHLFLLCTCERAFTMWIRISDFRTACNFIDLSGSLRLFHVHIQQTFCISAKAAPGCVATQPQFTTVHHQPSLHYYYYKEHSSEKQKEVMLAPTTNRLLSRYGIGAGAWREESLPLCSSHSPRPYLSSIHETV